MDQSSSSTGDPFGLRRPRRVSAFNNPSVSQQHPVSSPPNRRISPSNDDNSLSFSTSAYPPKPYNSKRLTVDTTSVITEDQDPVTASSIQTTPTSNARSTQRRQQQDRQQQHQQDHQQQHQQQDRHHQHPQQQDRQQHHQQQQQQQTSPPMPGMHPLNLSHISPQHTVLSQLSESPDEPIYIRAPAAAATGRGASYHYNNSVHDNHLDTPTTATTTTDDLNSFRSRRRSTLSVGAAQQRQQLTQKMLVQLQEQMKRTQEELLQTQQETESLTENWQESQRSVAFLQQERDSWRQQYEQLQNAKMTDQEKMRGQLEETQAELEEWQGNLEKEARAVQQKKEQVAKQQQEWMDLQNTVQELETTQQEDQARLLEFDDELHQKQLSLEEVKRRFESNRREQERVLQKQQQDYGARQKHLKDWQQRLEAQVETLEARQREVTRAEEAIRRSNDQLVADLSEIELAHDELERRNASYEAKYILVEQAVEELTAKRQEEEDKVEAAEEWQRELAVQAEQISTDSKVVTQALHEKLSETHKEHNHLLEAIEEKNSELEDLKARVQLFVLEDRKGRQVAIQQAKEAARQLKTIVKEVENAQKQQDVVVQSVTDRTKEYEQLGVRIQKEEDQWEHEKQTMLERQQIHFKTLQNRLMGGITTLTTAATEKHEIVTMELKDRVLKLESLRENLSAVVRKYQRESVELEREKSDCMALREQLNIRVAHFASSEGREKRMREELEWEIKRLKTLIEAERRDYENRIAIGEDDSEEAQQRHRDELKGLAERLESVESQRDAATSELRLLRGEVDTNEKEFALQRAELVKEVQSLGEQRDSLVKEKRSLQEMHDSLVREKKSLEERHDTLAKEKRSLNEELTRAAKRTSEAETLLLEYRGEKITEKNEREKVKLLMSRLEEHSVALEKKEEETRKQRLALETANEDYNKTLKDLGIKVCVNAVVRFMFC
jgi:chromosome segregation ATPase